MCAQDDSERVLAIERYHSGEKPKAIYTSLGHSKYWFFKWLKRYDADNPQWFHDNSRRPLTSPYRIPDEVEKNICMTRRRLYDQNTFCGPQAILWQMGEDGIDPLPSESTIKRILKKYELINKRTGRYEPKGKKYPSLSATSPNDVQQFDFVGPCYLEGAFRFYSLHGLDVSSRRCAIEAMPTRKDVYLSVWDAWKRLGIPRFAQFDNALEFCGSRKHPRGMGQVIRLCLRYGVQAVFIPICEPWRNGHVEKFNDHWNKMFYSRIQMRNKEELERESLAFETRHNLSWRYSPLDGKTPLGFLKEHGTKLKFPSGIRPEKLSKPTKGKYHVMRFVRSDLNLDIFGEKFQLPRELQYEYVQATINVASERLQVYHNKIQVAEFSYKMR